MLQDNDFVGKDVKRMTAELTETNDELMLKDAFFNIMQLRGNTNYSIDNIRFFEVEENDNLYAMADISFSWQLNAWDKNVSLQDAIFVNAGDGWQMCF